MAAGLEAVHEDDDTNWAYTDKDREASADNSDHWTATSAASPLIDDESFIYPDNMSIGDDTSLAGTLGADTVRSNSSATSSQLMHNVELAQRQAQYFVPRPRHSITKLEWRTLMEFSEELIAKEMTRMDWIMFTSIRPRDLVRHVSQKPTDPKWKNLVNVDRMIKHFNHLAAWVQNYILLREKPKHRALMLEKMMKIARKLRELFNYNALGALIAGINDSSVIRLALTQELIPPHIRKFWASLTTLMSSSESYKRYRMAWEADAVHERIPFIPLHRRDLVSAEGGNKTFLGDENAPEAERRINWRKFEVMGEVIVSLQSAQGVAYRNLAIGAPGEHIRNLILEGKLTADEDVSFSFLSFRLCLLWPL